MKCSKCGGTARMVEVSAKCSDNFSRYNIKQETHYDGYVPDWLSDGGYGDYVNFVICRHCGQVHGDWPFDAPEGSKEKFKWGKAKLPEGK